MPRPDVVRVSADSPARAEAVWRCLADPFSYAQWVSGTAHVDRADEQWPAVGARLHHQFGRRPLRVRDHTTVLECEPPHRIVLAAGARPLGLVRAEVTVRPTADGCRVVLCEQLVGGLGARWPWLGYALQRPRNRRSLRLLLALAEGGEG